MSNLFLVEGGRTETQSTDTTDSVSDSAQPLRPWIKDHNSRQQELDWICIHAQNRGFKNGLLLGIMLGTFLSAALVLVVALS